MEKPVAVNSPHEAQAPMPKVLSHDAPEWGRGVEPWRRGSCVEVLGKRVASLSVEPTRSGLDGSNGLGQKAMELLEGLGWAHGASNLA